MTELPISMRPLSTDGAYRGDELYLNYGPCSRCGEPILDKEFPIWFWSKEDDGNIKLAWVYHERCVGIESVDDYEDEDDIAYYDEEDYRGGDYSDETQLDLGACCACGSTEAVRNVVALPYKSKTSGIGWGCVVCGLPSNGAIAVVCDVCIEKENLDIKEVCLGFAEEKTRIPYSEIAHESNKFEHDYSKHGL